MKKLIAALLVTSAITMVALVGSASAATVSPLASGLDSPRGLAFLPNGTLVVAEAGHGGDVCMSGNCIGLTGQISTIDLATGWHSPLVSGLYSLVERGSALGIDGLSAQGGRLLGIIGTSPQEIAGFNCSGQPADCSQVLAAAQSQAGSLLKFTPSGNWNQVANVGAFDFQFTVDNPGGSTYGTEIDANPYGLLALPSGTFVADAGSNTLDWVANNGKVSIVHRFPVPPMHVFPTDAVPTCVALAGGQLTIADLAGQIWHVDGGTATLVQGQTGNHYTGCAADAAGNVYVVSMWHTPPGIGFPNRGSGSIVKVATNGVVSTLSLSTTLDRPNGIAIGSDGALYVSVRSVCMVAPPNPCGSETGGVVKITP